MLMTMINMLSDITQILPFFTSVNEVNSFALSTVRTERMSAYMAL